MLPYYIIFSILAIVSFLDAFSVDSRERLSFLIVIWGILTLFAGLRYDNADWSAYVEAYVAVTNGEPPTLADPGFNGLYRFLSIFSSSPLFMFVAVAGISVGLNLNSFKTYSPYFLTAILIYFVHIFVLKEMIQIRGGLASAICLFSIRYLVKEKFKIFMAIWIMAVSIHFSTIIWGIVGICYWLKPSVKTFAILLFLSLLVGTIYPFGQIIKSYLGVSEIESRLGEYVAYGDEGFGGKLGVFTNVNALKSLVISTLSLFLFYKRRTKDNVFFYPILCAYICGTVWMLLFNDFAIIAGRMSSILLSVEPVVISYLFVLFSRDSRWCFSAFLVLITLTMFMLNRGEDKVSIYQFYF